MSDPSGLCLPNILLACANIKRAILIAVCQYSLMALLMPTSLKSDDPSATLQADGQEPFVAWAEPVRMSNAAEATTRTDPAPGHLAVDVRNVSLTFETADGKVDALSNVSLQVDSGEF